MLPLVRPTASCARACVPAGCTCPVQLVSDPVRGNQSCVVGPGMRPILAILWWPICFPAPCSDVVAAPAVAAGTAALGGVPTRPRTHLLLVLAWSPRSAALLCATLAAAAPTLCRPTLRR